MRYFKVIVSAFLVGLTGAMTPGPMLVAVVTLTAQKGFWQAPQIIVGHALVEIAIVVALWLGLAKVVRRGGRRAFLVMRIAGGVALVVLGMMMAFGSGRVSLSAAMTGDGPTWAFNPVLVGVVVSLSNPYFLFWWATVGLGLASQAIRIGRAGPPVFFVGHIHADIIWYLIVGAAVALGRRVISDAAYQWIILAGGIFLAGFGVYFATLARWRAPKPEPARAVDA